MILTLQCLWIYSKFYSPSCHQGYMKSLPGWSHPNIIRCWPIHIMTLHQFVSQRVSSSGKFTGWLHYYIQQKWRQHNMSTFKIFSWILLSNRNLYKHVLQIIIVKLELISLEGWYDVDEIGVFSNSICMVLMKNVNWLLN